MANMLFMALMARVVFGSSVSRCFQQWYGLRNNQISLVVLLCCLRHTTSHNFSSTKFALDQLFVTNIF